MDAGMKALIESFYRSIRENAPVPISYREILLTSRIMGSIFDQLRQDILDEPSATRSKANSAFQGESVVIETVCR